ncbi:monovalent cation:proton antiporter-2 (CPA2) family protein [Ensifer adhaerens]|uniref:monovalent cation:proton antiporter-2 (CPA2) family protein n=1 Tax=Ensifer adhaerens TaxID=106592 RepID=UPI001CBBB918|nr:monovalent cation:proton antiporter-2 (CPA2) family protein [Ensifer adhaerens]MBZ7924185.1 monovalent cation:proton antiporter-2 (CPA2) family protein [Ensifer adhaerens]UAX96557.1 monovalent cation:proton antiporter-2 (CPA2) family protein [Ensifer adhaerens]UAY04099.1 monovalent cation:proton antiporter-2 (CPA2) family protein [Ensifer adhaerens]UAY12085.1 monovalent cation:proton antiporter-2 (CPA2) family protein [Ensifer adhaerens]
MSFLSQAAIFLCAAVVAVPLSKKCGLGAVIGYLAAGSAIGPWGLRLVQDVDNILHFSEFGVVLLLFVIGLELQPNRLWTMRRPVFGAGGLQVAATATILGGAAILFGHDWRIGLVVGLAMSLSSTAFALQILAERGELSTRPGRTAFSILLFQDVAAIPILALVPLLGGAAQRESGMEQVVSVLTVVAALIAVVIIGRFVLRYALRLIARSGVREIFTASALLTVIGMALFVQQLGLSMALGAFLAGVLLADSEFRHALEADIEPFKGLLLGLFFIAVGMSVNFGLLATQIWLVLGLVAGLIAVKAAVLYTVGRLFGHDHAAASGLAVVISQGGEFAFVILSIAVSAQVLPLATAELLILVVIISMAATPLLLLLADWLRARRGSRQARPFDVAPNEENSVIIAGFGRFGQIVGRILQAKKIGFTALEISADHVDFVAKYGNKVYYGDASRLDLLQAAGTGQAKVFVLAIDGVDPSLRTAALLRAHFPKLRIVARARNRHHAHRLMDIGVDVILRETFFSGLEASRNVLEILGMSSREAEREVSTFRDHDERQLVAQYAMYGDERRLIEENRTWAKELEQIFDQDRKPTQC